MTTHSNDQVRRALERLLPMFERLLEDRAFTADKAGEVSADMQTLKRYAAIAQAPQPERQEMQVLELTPYFCGYARIQDGEYKLAGMHTTEVMNDGEVHPLYAFPNELIEALHAVPATQEQLKPFNGMTKVQAREWLETISSTSESAALCACKERPAFQCPGEWEPGCDLGNNEKYVDVSRQQTK